MRGGASDAPLALVLAEQTRRRSARDRKGSKETRGVTRRVVYRTYRLLRFGVRYIHCNGLRVWGDESESSAQDTARFRNAPKRKRF